MMQKFVGSKFKVDFIFSGGSTNIIINGKEITSEETAEECDFRKFLERALRLSSSMDLEEKIYLKYAIESSTQLTDNAKLECMAIRMHNDGYVAEFDGINVSNRGKMFLMKDILKNYL